MLPVGVRGEDGRIGDGGKVGWWKYLSGDGGGDDHLIVLG